MLPLWVAVPPVPLPFLPSPLRAAANLMRARLRPLQVKRSDTMPQAYEHSALQNREHKILQVEAAGGDDDGGDGGDDY